MAGPFQKLISARERESYRQTDCGVLKTEYANWGSYRIKVIIKPKPKVNSTTQYQDLRLPVVLQTRLRKVDTSFKFQEFYMYATLLLRNAFFRNAFPPLAKQFQFSSFVAMIVRKKKSELELSNRTCQKWINSRLNFNASQCHKADVGAF